MLLLPEQQLCVTEFHSHKNKYNPDYLILSTSTKEQALKIIQEPAFAKLKALQNNKVFFVDKVVQEAFSQYIVLAYYDLYQIILEINQK